MNMTDGIVIGFAVGFVAILCIGYSRRKETQNYLPKQRTADEPLKVTSTPRGTYQKYPNCRVGEKVYVKVLNAPDVFLVEVMAINEDGVIIYDPNTAADKQFRFYAHKNVFRTYKKEGTENE